MIRFSLVMSIYAKENPRFLAQCIDSILSQTVLPDELILVKDGPLTNDLDSILRKMRYPNGLSMIALPENITQGPARAEGVVNAQYEWVAIMDSDDICRSDRFEKQLEMIALAPELGLIGGQIAEFSDDPDITATMRVVPTQHDKIFAFLKKRNPFNSMTVMFKRDLALEAGNFRYFPGFEDYDLWARMIMNGVVCANLPDVLVDTRVGGGMYGRRRGVQYISSELKMQNQLKSLGIINSAEFVRNCALRAPIRLLPEKALERIYSTFARR